jgi:hypothetical protein
MPAIVENPVETPGQIIAKHQIQAPVDVVAIASDLGLNVWAMDLPDSISGKIFADPINGGARTGFSIAVNSSHSTVRQRFTVAHEIAHFILHRQKLEGGDLVDDAMYRSGLRDCARITSQIRLDGIVPSREYFAWSEAQ